MILIASALTQELRIAKHVRGRHTTQYLCTGIGNISTTYHLTKYLATHKEIQQILFIGICGRCNLKTKPDLIQIANVIYASTNKEFILPVHVQYAPLHTILSSDIPIYDTSLMQGYHFVDMESWGAAYVANQYKLPLTILRVPVDQIASSSYHTIDYTQAGQMMKKSLSSIVLKKY